MHTRGAVLLDSQASLSATHERVARLLKDYNPDLDLQYIPEKDRGAFDAKPFRVVHHAANGEYVVGYFAAKDVNATLIAHIFKHDKRNRNVLSDLEADEAAREALLAREALDKHEERMDFARSIIKSKKHSYRHNGVTYK